MRYLFLLILILPAFLHQAVKQAVVRHKESQLTPQTSTEVE